MNLFKFINNINEKKSSFIYVFKFIIATFLVIAFTVSVISCKEIVEEQQQEEEKPAVEVSDETKEETKEETPPVIEEETPEPIEWEGITFFPIEGLRFDKGTFFAEAGNPYNLEEGEKAGVFVKDAVEINGVMESSIGLRPEVIEVMQKEIMEKDKEFRYPLPFNFEEAKGIKIREVKDIESDEWAKSKGYFWDNNTFLEISNVPVETIIYSPVSTKKNGYSIMANYFGERSDYYIFTLVVIPDLFEESYFKNEKIDQGWLQIFAIGINLLPLGIEKNIPPNEKDLPLYETETKVGTPIAKVVSQEYLDNYYWDKENIPSSPSNEPSISISYNINQLKPMDKDGNFTGVNKFLNKGLDNLLKLGEEKIPVFISSAQ